MKLHGYDYRKKAEGSSLWRHTAQYHGGSLGPDKGSRDYQMVHLETWTKPLDRLTGEGLLITELEEVQSKKQAMCLNSKKDFRQSHSVTLNFNIGSNLS